MEPGQIIDELKARGFLFAVEGDKLKWDAPANEMTPEIEALITHHKPDLMDFIRVQNADSLHQTVSNTHPSEKGPESRNDDANPDGQEVREKGIPRTVKRGEGDYPRVFRPCRTSEVHGQDEIKMTIGKGLDDGSLAHSMLLHGKSGTGKTTTARIIAMGLNCEKGRTSEPCTECGSCRRVMAGYHMSVFEMNAADLTGIDDTRKLRGEVSTGSFDRSRHKIFIFAECHQLSREAQNMLLKLMQDSGNQNFFSFCSTHPEKIIETLKNRCMPFEFKELPQEELRRLIEDVCRAEGVECQADSLDGIVKEAEGKARNALFLLQKHITARDKESRASPNPPPPAKLSRGSSHGAREWTKNFVNCCTGCSHDCRYCYARETAVRHRRVRPEEWKNEGIRQKDVDKGYRRREGRIMFPSSHDITPSNVDACIAVLGKLLHAGNKLLIVSKPHLECITRICYEFGEFKESILFRFTIGAMDNKILSFWEPNAPSYEERLQSLKFAWHNMFQTSVSIEPMLDPEHIEELVTAVSPLVTDAIWIGKMNDVRKRVAITDETVEREVRKIEAGQTDDRIKAIYEKLKDNPKIKWKESIKKVVGLPLSEKPGMDM